MHAHARAFALSSVFTTALAVNLAAQRPVEIGMDAAFQFLFEGGATAWSLSVPIQQARFGFMASDRLSVEPRFAFSHVDNGASLTVLQAGLHLLYYYQPTAGGSRPYVTVGGTLLFVDASFGRSDTQFQLGAGIGVLLPIVSRLFGRLEARYDRGFSPKLNGVAALFGLSFFTR